MYSVSLDYLVLLHPGCQHLPSLIPAQEGWNVGFNAHRLSTRTEMWNCAWIGLVLLGPTPLTPPTFPHSHYSGTCAGDCMDPCDMDSVYNSYGMLYIYHLALELHQDPSHLLPPHTFLLQQHQTP